ncbi:MAG: transglutaminase-like domain-containing protein, partial [Dehalococcoidia bacterium]
TLNNLPESYYVYLLLYLLASLLLVVHLNMLRHQREWADRLVSFPRLVGLSHLGHLFWMGMIVLFLAWNVPQVGLAPLSGMLGRPGSPWERIQDQFGRLFASLPSQKPAPVLNWGESHPFAGPLLLGDRMLFTVDSRAGHYWRARVYDVYTPQGWVNSPLVEQALEAGTSRGRRGLLRARVAHTVRTNSFAENLFTAGEPLRASMSTIVVRQQARPGDLIMMRPQRELRLAQRYSVISLVSAATSSQLREAGSRYPEAVSDRYLQLPPDLSRRIRRLSRTITQGISTPFDKAIAIQQYLRAIPYDTNIAAPPPGADGVDYFLFSMKAGYCDYYASAMAVMLRSVGVPSRFVLGYQPGDWDGRAGVYAVREFHYHSWPEVYFPGYGWVEFEPTPSQAERVYAPPSDEALDEALEDDEGEMVDEDIALGPPALLTRGALLFWGVGMALLLAFLVSVLAWYRRWWMLSRLDFPASVYAKVSRLASMARIGPQPHDTPSEYAYRLSAELPS